MNVVKGSTESDEAFDSFLHAILPRLGIGDSLRNLADRWYRGACSKGQQRYPDKKRIACDTYDIPYSLVSVVLMMQTAC